MYIYIYILEKFQCTSLIKFSFDEPKFLIFNFDITLTYFLNPHFSIFLCVTIVMSSFQKLIKNS